MDPFERADHESILYEKWIVDRMFVMAPAQKLVFDWLGTFKEFPPMQDVASWSIDAVMQMLTMTDLSGPSFLMDPGN